MTSLDQGQTLRSATNEFADGKEPMLTKSQDRVEARRAARFALLMPARSWQSRWKLRRGAPSARRTARQLRWSPAVRVRLDSRPPNQARVWCT